MQGLFNFQFFNQVRKYLNLILYYNIHGLMIYPFIENLKKQKYRKCEITWNIRCEALLKQISILLLKYKFA